MLFIASIFGFAMIYFWIRTYKTLKVGNECFNCFFEETQSHAIDNKHFFHSIFFRSKRNRNTFATGVLYLLVISSSIGIIMMWVSYGLRFPIFANILANFVPATSGAPEFALYDPFVKLSPLLSTLTYFTQFTSLACFTYSLTTMIKPRANLFRNNTTTIHLATYITIVSVVYWMFLYGKESKNTFDNSQVQSLLYVNLVTTIVLHITTPITFIFYGLIIIWYNHTKPVKYWKSWKIFIIYPITYAFFMYSLPIFAKPSVYGPIVNLNPFNRNEFFGSFGGIAFPVQGEPMFIFFILLFWLAFAFVFFLFWFYAMQIYKIQIVKKIKLQPKSHDAPSKDDFSFITIKKINETPETKFKKGATLHLSKNFILVKHRKKDYEEK